ncbi:hypothetical protein D3C75_1145150 [compost metagenome]
MVSFRVEGSDQSGGNRLLPVNGGHCLQLALSFRHFIIILGPLQPGTGIVKNEAQQKPFPIILILRNHHIPFFPGGIRCGSPQAKGHILPLRLFSQKHQQVTGHILVNPRRNRFLLIGIR